MSHTNQLNLKGFKLVPTGNPFHEGAESFHQKCVRDEDGDKLYYINVYEYKHPRLTASALQWEVQFHLVDGNTFDVTLCTIDVDYAEVFFANIFTAMSCMKYSDWC